MKMYKSIITAVALTIIGGFVSSCGGDNDNPKLEFASGDFVVSHTELAVVGTKEYTLSIKSPVKPSLSADAQWIHLGEPSTTSSKVYTVRLWCDENSAYDVRTGTVSVEAGGFTKTVAISQYGAETVEIRSLDPGATLLAEGGVLTLNYAATGAVDVKAPEWLQQIKSKALTENAIQFSYSVNYGEAERTGEIVISLSSDASVSKSVTVKQANMKPSSDMSDNALQLVKKIYAGVNIGNTMECPGEEGAWSGTKVNETYVKGLKALGFNAVRVPCAWDSHVSDKATNTIDPAWLDRVNEVVGMIVANDMYAIVNIHWDGGWLEESCVKGYDEAVNKKQHDYWTQIAGRLNHFDQHLLFAGMNEPGQQDQGGVNSSSMDAMMKYQQTFVDAVRATGGNNATRCLVHQAPYTNIDKAVEGVYHLPSDKVSGRSILEVHFYDPSDYTIMGKDGEWGAGSKVRLYWGKNFHVEGSDRNCTWGEEDYVDAQFKKIKDKYVSAGIPVIVGEYSTSIRKASDFNPFDKAAYEASRAHWNEYVTMSAKNHGCATFYWETGSDISRSTGVAILPYAIDALMNGAKAGKYPF